MDLPITPILCEEFAPFLGQVLTPEVLSRLVAKVAYRCYPGPVDYSAVEARTVGSYVLSPSRLIPALPELKLLHAKHWHETETYRHELQARPDYQRGLDLEMQGRYMLLIARHVSGAIVGNYGLYLARSMHTQELVATEDTLFIDADHRNGRLGVRFIQYAEYALAQLGVTELSVDTKTVNGVGPMIERMGYPLVGTRHTKILKPKEVDHVLA